MAAKHKWSRMDLQYPMEKLPCHSFDLLCGRTKADGEELRARSLSH
jgi:hypothetical protein